MLALEARERALWDQKYKEANAVQYDSEGVKYNVLTALAAEGGKAVGKIRDQREALEKTCRAAAARSILDFKAFQDLKDSYDEAIRAYDIAKDLYLKPPAELAEDAVNSAANRLADETVASAYTRRNNAYSAALENVLNDAKRKILDLIPKSNIVAAIQNASFDRLKAQAQQLVGDMNRLESDIRSVQVSLSRPRAPSADVTATVPLSRPGSSALFRDAINQAEQEERERPIREARERARLAKVAEDEARVRRETLARLELERARPVPSPAPALRAPTSGGSGVCERERQQVIAVTQGKNRGDTNEIFAFVQGELAWGNAFREYCHVTPRCALLPANNAYKVQPTSPVYGEALRAFADIAQFKARGGESSMTGSQYMWHACVARHMAAQIR